MTSGFPLPQFDASMQPFWDFTNRSVLALQHCKDCGDVHFPPGPVCPVCLSEAQEWRPASGSGTLFSWCEFHKSYWDSVADLVPYRVAIVKLEEGPLFITNLVDVADDSVLKAELPVEVLFRRASADFNLPVFRLK